MSTATTYTAVTNDRLRTFLAALGYEAVAAHGEMVVLSRSLPRPAC
jgi:hypothetical protein